MSQTMVELQPYATEAEESFILDVSDVMKPLPKIDAGLIRRMSLDHETPANIARSAIATFNNALASNETDRLSTCFYPEQAFWRDIVALTSHIRTLTSARTISSAFLALSQRQELKNGLELVGSPQATTISSDLVFIDCWVSFHTKSPALDCGGRVVLLPVLSRHKEVTWKIWILSTWIDAITACPEDERLLRSPGKDFSTIDTVETDVMIVGAGTAGLMTAARLKALNVDCVVIERHNQIGDSWSNRYDCLKFHVPTSGCELPYTSFPAELKSPHRLTKYDIARHLQRYAAEFQLSVLLSSTIQSTSYNEVTRKWTFYVRCMMDNTVRMVISKHFVQATNLGCGKPYIPSVSGVAKYQGTSIHSTQYKNASEMRKKGVKSVIVVGAACTAFDIMQDCHKAGLATTMIARSPTFILPYDYVMSPQGIGAYDTMPLDAADKLLNTMPGSVDGQLSHALFSCLASQERDRYTALAKAGFPVFDGSGSSAEVLKHLLQKNGGHYVDVGGTDLIAEGKVAVRGYVEPVSYTGTGLRLSDNSTLDADAIIWCTGYAQDDIASAARNVLGAARKEPEKRTLGPEQIAARLDGAWGYDAEGESIGVCKRHVNMDSYWVIGGLLQHQRWWSRSLVQQIKLAVEGNLLPAYRETPAAS